VEVVREGVRVVQEGLHQYRAQGLMGYRGILHTQEQGRVVEVAPYVTDMGHTEGLGEVAGVEQVSVIRAAQATPVALRTIPHLTVFQ
jgi:hypothetical protein